MSEKDLILAQEVARYIHDPLGFVLAMFDWDSPELKPFGGPDQWQIDFLNELADSIKQRRFDGAVSVPPIRMGRSSGHGIGKGHPLDMPFQQGYWGDLKPGDFIHVPNGSIYPILATRKYRQEHFKVTFDDGSSTVVSKEHEWLVRGRQERRKNLLAWRKLETQEIINLGVKRPNGNSMARQWELPLTEPVTYSESAPSVDAYTYGVWLGDGDKRTGRVTNLDQEVWDNLPYDTNVNGKTRTLLGLKSDLINEGLFGCTTYNASVDPRYLRSEQRLNVLQGLLDTDGWVEQCGSAAFCSASRQLVKDVVWMARSLGLKAREEKYKPNDKAGAWTTHITWDGITQLFRIERKQSKLIKAEHRYQCRWIDSIESVGEMDGMCIEVPGGVYLANDFIPTHNSALVAWVILFIMSTRPYAKGVVTANTSEQLKTKTWAELGKWHKKCLTADWFDFFSSRGNLALVSKRFPSEWRVDAQTCREENSESFAGLHAANSTPFYIFDEASAVPDKIWEVSEGGTTDGEPMWFVFGNPTRNTGRFYQSMFGSQRHRWQGACIDSRSVKITNKERIQEWIDDYGEDSDFVRVRVRGLPPSRSVTQFVDKNTLYAAKDREPTEDSGAPVIVGVDVARFGDDHSVIITRVGRDAKSIPYKRYTHQDTQQLGHRVVEHVEWLTEQGYGYDIINIDGGGVGGGVVDFLKSLNYNVNEVNFGGKAQDPKKYANKGSEMWGRMRDWLNNASIPSDIELEQELMGREYGFARDGQLMLEKKSDMKKRGLPSPDIADALALTFAENILRRDMPQAKRRMRTPSQVALSEYDIFDEYAQNYNGR